MSDSNEKNLGHSENCSCKTCFTNKQGKYGAQIRYEKKILQKLKYFEVHVELRLFDEDGLWTAREGTARIEW